MLSISLQMLEGKMMHMDKSIYESNWLNMISAFLSIEYLWGVGTSLKNIPLLLSGLVS